MPFLTIFILLPKSLCFLSGVSMLSAVRVFHRSYSWKKLLIPCLVAFIIRSAVFYYYVQHDERYRQADSNDYHYCALFIALGNGMSRIDNNQPIFWRTPLYPWYLSKFYKFNGINSGAFAANITAIKQALWIQIALSSLIPLLIFYLALLLTGSIALSWIAAWISVFHLGFILASTFLLTEALSLLFFILFLFFFIVVLQCMVNQNHERLKWAILYLLL